MGIDQEQSWGQSALALQSVDMVVAAIPHMLGFPPEDSVVVVGMGRGNAAGPSVVRLVQRFDTPDPVAASGVVGSVARDAAVPMSRAGVSEVVVVVFGSSVADLDGALPAAWLVDEVVLELEARDIVVRDALYTDGSSRWSYGCDDPSCCPPEGRLIPDESRTFVAAEFAAHGAAMVSSRQSLTDELAPDPAGVDARELVAALVDATPTTDGEREAWRTDRIDEISRILSSAGAGASGGSGSPDTVARSVAGLRDIRVRDTVMWEIAQHEGRHQRAIDALAVMVRSAPDGQVAPAATTLAIAQWLAGDGARANAAIARALDDEPGYRLAQMIQTAIRSGMPPQTFRECVTELSRETCRHGHPTTHQDAGPVSPRAESPASVSARSPAPAVEPVVMHPPTSGLAI